MTVTGVLVVKNQSHIVDLTIRSSHHAVDDYLIIDNCSEDSTIDVIEETLRRVGTDYKISTDDRYVGDIFTEAVNSVEEYALRLEGDQVYFKNHLSNLVSMARPHTTITGKVYLLRNRIDLTRNDRTTNAPHPSVYHNDGSIEKKDGRLWPRSDSHRSLRYTDSPFGVNLNIDSPKDRIRRWHRASWWRWGDREIPENMEIPGIDMPYQDHMTLDEYIWELRELEKGSYLMGWHGDSLSEIGREYVKWDIENNCSPYEGPYPDILKEEIRNGRF